MTKSMVVISAALKTYCFSYSKRAIFYLMAQFNKSLTLLLFFMVLCWALPGHLMAQSPLDLIVPEQVAKQYSAPIASKLTSNWWQAAIQSSPKELPYKNLSIWSEQLQTQLKSHPESYNQEDSQAITQFHTNVQELQKRFSKTPVRKELNFNDPKPYQLSDIFERIKTLRQLRQLLNDQNGAANDFTAEAIQQRQQIDQLVIHYGALSVDNPERIHTGLLWMAYRSWVALNELQASQATIQKNNTELSIQDLQNYITQMTNALKPNTASIGALERQILINLSALEQAKNTVLQSSQTFAQSQKNDTLSGFESDINRLQLVQDMMSQRRLELALARDYIHLDWINNSIDSNAENKNTSIDRITQYNKLISETNEQLAQWRKLAQDILLAPAGHQGEAGRVKKAFEKRTNFAQDILFGMDEISGQQDKVTFLLSILTEQIADPKSGMTLWWSNIKAFGSSAVNAIDDVVNKPLFRINETPITLRPLLQLAIIIFIGFIFSKLARLILGHMEHKRDSDHSPLFFMLNKLSHYFIVIVTVLASFSTLGINLSNLTLIAGALSVGIGFGLQNIVSNFVSGLTIMFERSLKVGDYIELENGITGSVKEINARSTRINTNDNIDVVIPNSDLVTNQIINWTLRDSIKRVKIPFGVAYGTDKDLVRKAAQEAAEKVPFTLTNMKGKEPEVWMTGFGDNSIDFVLLVWVSKYGVRRPNRIKASFLWELDNSFIKHGIEVPFPQRVIHYANEPNEPQTKL